MFEVCSWENTVRMDRAEFPDEQDRYGDAGLAWCVHDNQHILNWAVNERNGYGGFERQLTWLGGGLEARDFPLDRLARNLEIGAEVLERGSTAAGTELAAILSAGRGSCARGRPSSTLPADPAGRARAHRPQAGGFSILRVSRGSRKGSLSAG